MKCLNIYCVVQVLDEGLIQTFMLLFAENVKERRGEGWSRSRGGGGSSGGGGGQVEGEVELPVGVLDRLGGGSGSQGYGQANYEGKWKTEGWSRGGEGGG